MKKEYYCRYCGQKLQEESTGAENYYFECEAGRIYTTGHYNTKTGRRQIVFKYTCPSYKESFWNKIFYNKHDCFMNEDVYEEVEFGKWVIVK